MAGTFHDRIQLLRDNVGSGKLEGSVEVDQVYAAWIHFGEEFQHPEGGKAYYLRDPMFEHYREWLTNYAKELLKDDGRGGASSMMESMESLSFGVYENAPFEFGDLKGSGHPSVRRNNELLHDRAPNIPRLPEDELKAKKRLSRLLDPDRYKKTTVK